MNNEKSKNEREYLKSILLFFIFTVVSLFTLKDLHNNSSFQLSPIILLFISYFSFLFMIKKYNPTPYIQKKYEKWLTLYGAILLLFIVLYYNFYREYIVQLSLFLAILSLVSYLGGRKIFLKTILPLAILLFLLPYYQQVYYWLSYPIRLICTKLTVIFLSVFGFNITSTATVISIGSKKVAITAACSGLILLETLSWIGWLIVIHLHESTLKKLFHFLLILPIVFISNTLRLIILVVLYNYFGEIIIISPIHCWLGYFMIVLASYLLYLCKYFFDKESTND
jgi:exosortase